MDCAQRGVGGGRGGDAAGGGLRADLPGEQMFWSGTSRQLSWVCAKRPFPRGKWSFYRSLCTSMLAGGRVPVVEGFERGKGRSIPKSVALLRKYGGDFLRVGVIHQRSGILTIEIHFQKLFFIHM